MSNSNFYDIYESVLNSSIDRIRQEKLSKYQDKINVLSSAIEHELITAAKNGNSMAPGAIIGYIDSYDENENFSFILKELNLLSKYHKHEIDIKRIPNDGFLEQISNRDLRVECKITLDRLRQEDKYRYQRGLYVLISATYLGSRAARHA